MIVLKIGGSLYQSDSLNDWLAKLEDSLSKPVVIVPGGGPFADQVRDATIKWQLSNQCGHDMAVMGMQQFAHLMQGLNNKLKLVSSLQEILQISNHHRAIIWAPYEEVVRADDIEKDWQTTSDSLAAWLASKLAASHLCLVKSASVANKSLSQLIDSGVVDKNFNNYLDDCSSKLHFYHATEANKFIEHLLNGHFS